MRAKYKRLGLPFNKDRDRFVIAVSPETPNTVAAHLAKASVLRFRSMGISSQPRLLCQEIVG